MTRVLPLPVGRTTHGAFGAQDAVALGESPAFTFAKFFAIDRDVFGRFDSDSDFVAANVDDANRYVVANFDFLVFVTR